ncbi:hypothetical protein SUGI_0215270 [Cryptomeria japonica]|nr:hypothetical protein SUGI_0215270 [Cryptomeria japonica]
MAKTFGIKCRCVKSPEADESPEEQVAQPICQGEFGRKDDCNQSSETIFLGWRAHTCERSGGSDIIKKGRGFLNSNPRRLRYLSGSTSWSWRQQQWQKRRLHPAPNGKGQSPEKGSSEGSLEP